MSKMTKFMSVLVLSGGVVAAFCAPAKALSIIAPVDQDQPQTQNTAYVNSPIAFAGGTSGSGGQNKFSLTSDEIMHVQWCAERYKMSYNATDNTYTTAGGKQAACVSPK